LVLLAIVALLLSRPHGDHDENAPDVRAASAAAGGGGVVCAHLGGLSGYVAVALTLMWQAERAGLVLGTSTSTSPASSSTIAVAIRAHARVGRRIHDRSFPNTGRSASCTRTVKTPRSSFPPATDLAGRSISAAPGRRLDGRFSSSASSLPVVILALLLR
jgi:hypothetical protein